MVAGWTIDKRAMEILCKWKTAYVIVWWMMVPLELVHYFHFCFYFILCEQLQLCIWISKWLNAQNFIVESKTFPIMYYIDINEWMNNR